MKNSVQINSSKEYIEGSATAEAEKKYKILVDRSTDAFFLALPGGAIIESNMAACSMFGYSHDEFKTTSIEYRI